MATIMNFIEQHIREEVLCLIWLLYFWELYISLRQRHLMQKLVDLPESLDSIMPKDIYTSTRLYALDKNSFSIIKNLFSTVLTTVLISMNAFFYIWERGIGLAEKIGIDKSNEMFTSTLCMLIINAFTTLVYFPFEVYHTFVLEEKHGFNKQTALFFVKDQAKMFVVTQVITLPLICGIIWIVQHGGDYFFMYLWLFTTVISLFMLVIYPEVIAPLFDKYSPLPEGELRKNIEALALSLDFPLYKLYVVEGSVRSSHSNAYMYGFYKHKRIVLFDTLLKEYYKPDEKDNFKVKGCETNEVLAVLAHELGHWKFSHTLKGFIASQLMLMVNFVVFAKLFRYRPMYSAFGFMDKQPILIGLIIVMMYILMPLNTLMAFLLTVNARKYEFQADKFAKTLGRAESLKRALITLQKDNLGYPLFDKLYSGWHHSHPPLLERLEALNKED
ncbi:CAAX prenyl protease 1 homolog [Orussus abietinus]|uniref:CAAX prenyl protease 1 homolog n=1 Tax=Orussus abietinus TaxID=222816 RepID=UPI0006258EC2|nr:CAAX prenyl protease 1 homolog [Orussus abietinus]